MSEAIFAAVSMACFELSLRVSAVIEPRHSSRFVPGSSKNPPRTRPAGVFDDSLPRWPYWKLHNIHYAK